MLMARLPGQPWKTGGSVPAVYHPDRALMAGLGTETAAVAFLFVDLNNSSFHMVSLRLVFCFGLFDFMGTIYYNRTMQSVVFTTK